MVDVTPIGAAARHLLPEQLGAIALDDNALVKLGHIDLPVLLQHVWITGSFRAEMNISQIASFDVAHKLS
jgi:hypothetical protein